MKYPEKKVLIIDDSATLRRIVHEALNVFEFQIFEADGATQAMAVLKEHKPDLILLDWHMPEMDGFDLFCKIHAMDEFKDVPVIMLTAEDRRDSMLKAIRAGIRHYLTKPFTHEDLLARVVQVLKLSY